MDMSDAADGIHEEALERLHAAGPERLGRLTNHAPMVVEVLTAHGRADRVHRWLDRYAHKLEDFPATVSPVTDADWTGALGDPRRAADWIGYFARALDERPWRDVLAWWWPRLLPGMYGGSTHPVIRVGHAVRALGAAGGTSAPRRTELAHALGYWAARHRPVSGIAPLPGPPDAAAALAAVPPVPAPEGGFAARLALVGRLPVWAAETAGPEEARRRLAELVRAATHRYATHGHGEETMLVHAATAPNAVLRTLPALPPGLWAPSLHAAWTAAAAVTAMYPAEAVPYAGPGERVRAEDVLERAVDHGDEHVIKLADTVLDVGDGRAVAAALRATALTAP